MRFTVLLTIAALTTTCFAAGGTTSETGAWIGSAHADAVVHVVAAADLHLAREQPQQCLLPPPAAGEGPAPVAAAPSPSEALLRRTANPPQGPPA